MDDAAARPADERGRSALDRGPCALASVTPRSSSAAASSCFSSSSRSARPGSPRRIRSNRTSILGVTPPRGLPARSPGTGSAPTISAATSSRASSMARASRSPSPSSPRPSRRLSGPRSACVAGWRRGWVDAIVSRLVEIWMAFPPVLLSILLVAVVGAGVGSVIAAIAIIDWTRFCRVVRAETMAQASERLCHGRARDRLFADAHPGCAKFFPMCCRC